MEALLEASAVLPSASAPVAVAVLVALAVMVALKDQTTDCPDPGIRHSHKLF